jgi:tRNA dimethylallyltransferase
LEVFNISGQPMSSFQKKYAADQFTTNNIANYSINTSAIAEFLSKNRLFISLEPENRAWLHERIEQRFDQMLACGFELEVRTLRERGDLHLDTPSIRCVGYRQMWEALDSASDKELDKKTASDMREKGIAATRQLCKRQLTWLRSMPQRQVVKCDAPDATEQVINCADAWIKNYRVK